MHRSRYENFYERKIVIIFLPINLNIPRWDGSFEYPQHKFWMRNSFPVHTLLSGSRDDLWKQLGPRSSPTDFIFSFLHARTNSWYSGVTHSMYFHSAWGQNFFISWFTNPATVIFRKVEIKKLISKIIFIFYPLTLNIVCFVEIFFIYFWGSVCVFLRVTLLKVIVLPMMK